MFLFLLFPLLSLFLQSHAAPSDYLDLLPLDVDGILPPDFMPDFPSDQAIPNTNPPSPPWFPEPSITFPTPLQIFQDDLFDAIQDPRLLPVPPGDNSHVAYDIDCSSGKLPPASSFPKSRPRHLFRSLTQVCSIYTSAQVPHLGCQCRNPGLGDWIICYGSPWADSALSQSPALQSHDPSIDDLSVLDACYKHCKCKRKVPEPPFSSDSDLTTTGSGSKAESPWSVPKQQTPSRDGSSGSLASSTYALAMGQNGLNIVIAQTINLLPSRAVVARLDKLGLTPPGGWACSMSGGWNGTCPPFSKLQSSSSSSKPPNPSYDDPKLPPKPLSALIPGIPPEAAPRSAPVCAATCDVRNRFDCGKACKCVANQIRGGLSHLAGCMSTVAVARLLKQQGRSGGSGVLGAIRGGVLGRRSASWGWGWGGRGEEAKEDRIRWGCPCNASYVSEGCCVSESGVVWEGIHLGMGTLRM